MDSFENPKFFKDRAQAPMFSPSWGFIKIKPKNNYDYILKINSLNEKKISKLIVNNLNLLDIIYFFIKGEKHLINMNLI